MFVIPKATAPPIRLHMSHPPPSFVTKMQILEEMLHHELMPRTTFMHPVARGTSMQFPEVRLIQYDCGKNKTNLLVLLQPLFNVYF